MSNSPKKSAPDPLNEAEPSFGWSAYAERLNGRFAMFGLAALIILEALTKQDLLTWLGLK